MMLIYILVVIVTFFLMEGVAWAAHKYIMHGLGWYFHKDHHQTTKGPLEKNDFFFVFFSMPSIIFLIIGSSYANPWLFSIGVGIGVYGFAYFLVHDIFIHNRAPWFKRTSNVYLRAIRKAHKVHHKHLGKHDGESFGMLIVPLKYFREALRTR